MYRNVHAFAHTRREGRAPTPPSHDTPTPPQGRTFSRDRGGRLGGGGGGVPDQVQPQDPPAGAVGTGGWLEMGCYALFCGVCLVLTVDSLFYIHTFHTACTHRCAFLSLHIPNNTNTPSIYTYPHAIPLLPIPFPTHPHIHPHTFTHTQMRASKALQDRVLGNPRITVHYDTSVVEIMGDDPDQPFTCVGLIRWGLCIYVCVCVFYSPSRQRFPIHPSAPIDRIFSPSIHHAASRPSAASRSRPPASFPRFVEPAQPSPFIHYHPRDAYPTHPLLLIPYLAPPKHTKTRPQTTTKQLPVRGVFYAIGHDPNTALFKPFGQ